jgi:DNA recombination-dependent growth factor C
MNLPARVLLLSVSSFVPLSLNILKVFYYFSSIAIGLKTTCREQSEPQRLSLLQQAHMQNTVGDGAVLLRLKQALLCTERDIHLH